MSNLIPPGERRELRAVVRQQIKVLRAEVKQRRQEMVAEAESRLTERYRDEDKRVDELNWRIRELSNKANRELDDLLKEYADGEEGGKWVRGYGSAFGTPYVNRKVEDRNQLHRALLAGIETQVQDAQLQLDRQEADLLRALAQESLTSEAGIAFLDRIPSVAELVPSRRLKEIEQAFDATKKKS